VMAAVQSLPVTITMTPVEQMVTIGNPANITCRYDLHNRGFISLHLCFKSSESASDDDLINTCDGQYKLAVWHNIALRKIFCWGRFSRGRLHMSHDMHSIANITIPSVEVRHEGQYYCKIVAHNSKDPSSSPVTLIVSGKLLVSVTVDNLYYHTHTPIID